MKHKSMRTTKYVVVACFLLNSICIAVTSRETETTQRILKGTVATDTRSLDVLGNRPYRPKWAPLPILRGDTAAVSVLHKLLAAEDPLIRARSAFLLGQIASPNSVDVLVRSLKDAKREVRIHSGIALACMGDARGIPVCAAMMEDAPPWIRYYAVYGLWVTNTTRARNILSRYKRDKDPVVGPAVIRALSTPFVAPPPVPRGLTNTNRVSALHADVFLDGCDIMIAEADWWWHKGNFHQSIRCLEAAVFLYPTYVDGYSSIAWLHWSLGREADAVRALKRAVETMPGDPEPYFELGLHYYRTSQYELAEEPFAKAIQLGPDFRTRRMYAHCLEKVGKLEDALRQWTTIVNEDPSDSIANRNLQRVKQLVQKKSGPQE